MFHWVGHRVWSWAFSHDSHLVHIRRLERSFPHVPLSIIAPKYFAISDSLSNNTCHGYRMVRAKKVTGTTTFVSRINSTLSVLATQLRLPRKMDVANVELTRQFFKIGTAILGIDHRTRLVNSLLELFRSNFKYSPNRCAFLFLRIVDHPSLPSGYEPKHLLWTLHFLLTYATERRLCCFLKSDRKTIRKYIWPTITALSRLSHQHVSPSNNHYEIRQSPNNNYCTVGVGRFVGRTDC